jgi:predicted GNAT family N-acyltransferase
VLEVRRASEAELATCLAIRRQVFIVEQEVPEQDELDGRDPECLHFIALVGGEPAGTARLNLSSSEAKVERVAVLAAFRGRSLGAGLMDAIEKAALELGYRRAVLGAQVPVIPFYEKLGWVAEGPVFMDAGIPHRMMRKPL